MGATGFSIKLWRWSYEEGGQEFKVDNTTSFIFQDQPPESVTAVGELIRNISKCENLFQEVYSKFLKPEDGEVKGETDPVQIKLEPDPNGSDDDNKIRIRSSRNTSSKTPLMFDDDDVEEDWEENNYSDDSYTETRKGKRSSTRRATKRMRKGKRKRSAVKTEEDDADDSKDLVKDSSGLGDEKSKRIGVKKRSRTCDKCAMVFVWRKNFIAHLEECNPDQLKDVKLQPVKISTKLTGSGEVTQYMSTATGKCITKPSKGPFPCDRCSLVFQKFSTLVTHLKAHDLSAALAHNKQEDGKPVLAGPDGNPAETVEDGEGDVENEESLQADKKLRIDMEKHVAKSSRVSVDTDPHAAGVTEPQEIKLKKEEGTADVEMKYTEMRDGVVMKCEQCDVAYSTFQMYKNHMDQFHKKSLACTDCGQKFTLKNTLIKHRLDYHTLYPKACDECEKICLTAKDMMEHMQSHIKQFVGKTSPCEICGKLLKNKYSLKAHVEAVHEKRKGGDFTCDQCGKILKSKASLDYHRKSVHTQDYPFRCDICGKGFIKYNRMINCINNHQGIYKYRCPECDYKTNKVLVFKEHVGSHTGEKACFCPACEHQSNGTKNLGCHTKQVHKLTLCQAEIMYKRNRFGKPMTEDEVEDLKDRLTSLNNYDHAKKQGQKAQGKVGNDKGVEEVAIKNEASQSGYEDMHRYEEKLPQAHLNPHSRASEAHSRLAGDGLGSGARPGDGYNGGHPSGGGQQQQHVSAANSPYRDANGSMQTPHHHGSPAPHHQAAAVAALVAHHHHHGSVGSAAGHHQLPGNGEDLRMSANLEEENAGGGSGTPTGSAANNPSHSAAAAPTSAAPHQMIHPFPFHSLFRT